MEEWITYNLRRIHYQNDPFGINNYEQSINIIQQKLLAMVSQQTPRAKNQLRTIDPQVSERAAAKPDPPRDGRNETGMMTKAEYAKPVGMTPTPLGFLRLRSGRMIRKFDYPTEVETEPTLQQDSGIESHPAVTHRAEPQGITRCYLRLPSGQVVRILNRERLRQRAELWHKQSTAQRIL